MLRDSGEENGNDSAIRSHKNNNIYRNIHKKTCRSCPSRYSEKVIKCMFHNKTGRRWCRDFANIKTRCGTVVEAVGRIGGGLSLGCGGGWRRAVMAVVTGLRGAAWDYPLQKQLPEIK